VLGEKRRLKAPGPVLDAFVSGFVENFGIGPLAYIHLWQVHQVHQVLVVADPERTTVTNVAITLNQDTTLWSVLPHTHVRGKRWEVSVVYPDGRSEMILNVPKYDFNWQTDYVFKQPLQLPKGTRIHTAA
jgi:hypothetical protein